MLGDIPSMGGITADGFKIGEDESPRPLDRVFFTFNYWGNETPAQFQKQGIGQVDFYTERVGFEKTFLDGNASIGLRLPINTADADAGATIPASSSTALGNLDIILKYALINDRTTGNVLSAGVMVTAPTGPGTFAGFNPANVPIPAYARDTLLQPYLGGIYNWSNFYLHGFSSVVLPTDANDTYLMFNDLGVGYWLYRGSGFISSVAATGEVHINTPLTNVGHPIVDSVDLTQGLVFELRHRAWFTVGVAENVTRPETFGIEGIAQLNFRF